MNVRQVQRPLLVLLLVGTAASQPLAAHDVTDGVASEPRVAEFAVGRDGRPLLIPVSLDGQDYQFIVDTGAGKSTFDRSLKAKLGLRRGEQRIRTSAGFLSVEVFNCPQAKIGPWGLDRVDTVLCLDLQPIRSASGEDVYGILGMDFLRGYAVDIDFDRGLLRLLESAPQEWKRLGHRVPLSWERDCPVATVVLPGERRQPYLIDTGANITTVRKDIYESLLKDELLKPGDGQKSWTVNGEVENRIGYVDRLSFGPFSHRNLRLDQDPMSALGLNYLSRYRLRCDFPNSGLILEKGERYAKPEPNATSGMAILQVDGRKVVHGVHADGPADRAGLQKGDVVVKINDRQVSTLDLFEVGQQLTFEPERTVEITFERSNQIHVALLVLQHR